MSPQLGVEWYEALCDSSDEAKAQHAMDRAKSQWGESSLPFSDGAGFDPRANGRAN